MAAHDYHLACPNYDPRQLLVDGCGECEARSKSFQRWASHADSEHWDRAFARAFDLFGAQGDHDALGPISNAERPILQTVWSFQLMLESRGWPLGRMPLSPDALLSEAEIQREIAGDGTWVSVGGRSEPEGRGDPLCRCYLTGRQAVQGTCPEHHGDACLIQLPSFFLRARQDRELRFLAEGRHAALASGMRELGYIVGRNPDGVDDSVEATLLVIRSLKERLEGVLEAVGEVVREWDERGDRKVRKSTEDRLRGLL